MSFLFGKQKETEKEEYERLLKEDRERQEKNEKRDGDGKGEDNGPM